MVDEDTKETLARAIEAARENTRKLQSPMPHTIARKKRLERKKGKR
jgi:phage shock protein A